jgi:hypothetical protein
LPPCIQGVFHKKTTNTANTAHGALALVPPVMPNLSRMVATQSGASVARQSRSRPNDRATRQFRETTTSHLRDSAYSACSAVLSLSQTRKSHEP